mmetsp:Transcript_24142/g.51176  ORF Transcript_24142/g.51176 Transcript_24142/m.51176 type:complete len:366 (-) Transcript_24142:277-1374(-)
MVLTTMKSEGRNEVEAARKRLAAAKARGTAASETMATADDIMESAKKMMEWAKFNMATAKKNRDAARSQLDSSNEEIDEARKSWKDAKLKWDVDDDDSEGEEATSEEPNPKKRRRKSSSAISETEEQPPPGRKKRRKSSGQFVGRSSEDSPSFKALPRGRACKNAGCFKYRVAKCEGFCLGCYRNRNRVKGSAGAGEGEKSESAQAIGASTTGESASDGNDSNNHSPTLDNQRANENDAARAKNAARLSYSERYSEYPPTSSPRTSRYTTKLIVEGCGVPEVNGTYARSDRTAGSGGRVYVKAGELLGVRATFEISPYEFGRSWWITATIRGLRKSVYFYKHRRSEDRWSAVEKGELPLPRLRWP